MSSSPNNNNLANFFIPQPPSAYSAYSCSASTQEQITFKASRKRPLNPF